MNPFTATNRETLAGLADVLIPASKTMPSASDVGVEGELLDRLLDVRGDIADDLQRVLDWAAPLDAEEAVSTLRTDDDAGFQTLTFAVAGCYLMDKRVGELLRYPGQEAKQVDPFDYVSYVEEGLLEPVISRGPIFREAT